MEGRRVGPVRVAVGWTGRLRGLTGDRTDPGLLLRATTVHGMGLAAPLRVVGLDERGRVIGRRMLLPGGLVRMAGATWILELPLRWPPPPAGARLRILRPVSSGRCPAS